MNLFRNSKGTAIEHIRVSTLASYFFCAHKAYLQAAEGIDSPGNDATAEGSRIHDAITASRPPSLLEQQLETYLKGFMVNIDTGQGGTALSNTENKVFARAWIVNGETKGFLTTHGIDDFRVNPDKSVVLVEYKTTSQKVIDWYKLSTALFQLKVYAWILEPILTAGGYRIEKAELVYLPQQKRGKKHKEPWQLEPLGIRTIACGTQRDDYNAAAVEADIAMIFREFGNPCNMQPPARFKCYSCHPNYKACCPLQSFQPQQQVKPQ